MGPHSGAAVGMSLRIAFDNSFARLPDRLFAPQSPTPVPNPDLIALNAPLARSLGLDPAELASADGLAMLSGNTLPAGAQPLAQAYAGHQFGGFVPQLGDGRAILLGEVIDDHGTRQDIQLKGAGRTPFSRGGDGRAWLGPVMREYLVSEAMHALGVPTTRALAAVTTGATILRDTGPVPGAILTRVAPSHIRVGTFQYFAVRQDTAALEALLAYSCTRHFPTAHDAFSLLQATITAQAHLIAQWMGLGFIHGVMNTDNAHIGGLTIDYGPCAFMDGYNPNQVFSSIDHMGRYAYANQPQIAVWNMAQFATALLPLMGPRDAAIERATEIVHTFPTLYETAWAAQFRAKLGLIGEDAGDIALIDDFLALMATENADFTRSFRGLANGTTWAEFKDPAGFEIWNARWQARLASTPTPPNTPPLEQRLATANPAYIPRNHQIAAAITAGLSGDFAPFHRIAAVWARPYETQPGAEDLALSPAPNQVVHATFCGT